MIMNILDADKLTQLAAALAAQGYRVVAPLRDGPVVRIATWKPGAVIDTATIAVNSAKDVLFPPTEVIARYDLEGDDFTAQDVQPNSTKTVVLCVRPCDAASLKLLDTVFNWDFKDIYYNTRRAATTIVTMACTSADEACFCTSVRGTPDGTSGADAILRPAQGGKKLVLESLSDRGQAVVQAADDLVAQGQASPDPVAVVPARFDVDAITRWLADNFDSPLWKELSRACLGCGACAYACPSCHCFDLQDEATRKQAVRYRNWDACGLALFTAHTGGHNPRADQVARWRQRVMHKFSYIPQRFNLLGCTGCGRCARLCPNGLAIAEACEKIERQCKLNPAQK